MCEDGISQQSLHSQKEKNVSARTLVVGTITEPLKEAKTLEAVIQESKQQRPSRQEVAELAITVASALGALCEAGFVHRDIKPENILRY